MSKIVSLTDLKEVLNKRILKGFTFFAESANTLSLILKDEESKNVATLFIGRCATFINHKNQGQYTTNEAIKEINVLRNDIYSIIGKVADEAELIDDWADVVIEQMAEQEEVNETNVGYDPNAIAGGEHRIVRTKKDSEVDFLALENLLMEIEDHMAAEEWEEAEKLCDKACALTRKSPQIYEYWALSIYKANESNKIIKETLENNKNNALLQVLQKIRRCKQFMDNYEEDSYKEIALKTITDIGIQLTRAIKNYYRPFKSSAQKKDAGPIKKCLVFYANIYEALEKPEEFLGMAIHELSNLGKIPWLTVNAYNRVVNNSKYRFNALDMRSKFLNWKLAESTDPTKLISALAKGAYNRLSTRYSNALPKENEKGTQQIQKNVADALKSAKINFLLYKETDLPAEELIPFLDLIILEISSLERVSNLHWFDLGVDGELTTNIYAERVVFKALEELKFCLEEKYRLLGEEESEIEAAVDAYIAKCKYSGFERYKLEYKRDLVAIENSTDKNQLYRLLAKTKVLLQDKPTAMTSWYMINAFNQLTSDAKGWMGLSLDNVLEFKEAHLLYEFRYFLDQLDYSEDYRSYVKESLIEGLFNRAATSYNKVMGESSKERWEVWNAILDMERCFKISKRMEQLLPAINELSNQGKFLWIDHSKSRSQNESSSHLALEKREEYVQEVLRLEPTYNSPDIRRKMDYDRCDEEIEVLQTLVQ